MTALASGRSYTVETITSEIRLYRCAGRAPHRQMDDITLFMVCKGFCEETHFSFFYSPVRDDTDKVAGLFCACTEITGQAMAERRLRESEARFRGTQETSLDGFMVLDAIRDGADRIVDF